MSLIELHHDFDLAQESDGTVSYICKRKVRKRERHDAFHYESEKLICFEYSNRGADIVMEDIFAQALLCYLANRSDEGFQLIYSSITSSNDEILLSKEEQEVFCLISMNTIDKRYQSWLHLDHLLVQTDLEKKRQMIEVYLKYLVNELNSFSEQSSVLIDKYFFKSSKSVVDLRICYLKMEGDIHFLVGQTSQSKTKLQHIHSSLVFYNQALELCDQNHSYNSFLVSIACNKALIFILITEEYHLARDLLDKTLLKVMNNSNETDLKTIKSLLKFLKRV